MSTNNNSWLFRSSFGKSYRAVCVRNNRHKRVLPLFLSFPSLSSSFSPFNFIFKNTTSDLCKHRKRPRHLAAGYPNLGVSVRGSFGSKSLKVTLTTPLPTFMSPPSLSNWQSTASHELVISKKNESGCLHAARYDLCRYLSRLPSDTHNPLPQMALVSCIFSSHPEVPFGTSAKGGRILGTLPIIDDGGKSQTLYPPVICGPSRGCDPTPRPSDDVPAGPNGRHEKQACMDACTPGGA